MALNTVARRNTAVSNEAHAVWRGTREVAAAAERSYALFGAKAETLSKLQMLAAECAEPGWDGEGTEPVSRATVRTAADFIRALPEGTPLPELAAEPDGAISLDWICSRYGVFSLSVGRTSRLAYAWLDGADSGRGVVHFDGVKAPASILQGIESIIGHADAPLRAA